MRRERWNRSGRKVDSGENRAGRRRERALAALAARQRRVATRAQLVRIGLTRDTIDHRLRSGRLRALHRGVYLIGHGAPPPGARELAAALACGLDAVLSHQTAAFLWRLLPRGTDVLHVTVGGRAPGLKPGIRIHCVAHLDARDVRHFGGIPLTAPARTILDLARVVSPRELERVVAESEARRLTRRAELAAVTARSGRRPGVAALRSLLNADDDPALTRSEAEERLLALIRSADLPTPQVNVRVGRHEVDFLWRDPKLIVEVDGFAFHSSRGAFERDRLRDSKLAALGFRVIRVTWPQLVDRPQLGGGPDRNGASYVDPSA
jgi:hypothetical protein